MNIYFSGIGGVGIGPLAEIASGAGYSVQGSDLAQSLMTQQLIDNGVNVNIGQDGSFLQASHQQQPIDWFVYTAALPADHPELVLAQQLGIKVAKRDELLAHIIAEQGWRLIAIAGTHGKTTTTGMMVWAFKQLGIPVSYSVGTTLSFGPSGHFAPDAKYFVYECDEFDRNFLHFKPYLSLITSVDYDHPDTYPTADEYLEAFMQFGQASQQIITWSDQHNEVFAPGSTTTVLTPDQVDSRLNLSGRHNRRNASLVAAALVRLGVSNDISSILNDFPGTNRRFEKLADNLYSDYGHHPVEIAATLQLASELSDQIVLVYQPHQNVRQHLIRRQYTDQFELAETIYWLPTYLSREDPNLPILQPSELIENLTNHESVKIAEFDDQLWNNIESARAQGKLVLCMGAGKIDDWVRSRLQIKT